MLLQNHHIVITRLNGSQRITAMTAEIIATRSRHGIFQIDTGRCVTMLNHLRQIIYINVTVPYE